MGSSLRRTTEELRSWLGRRERWQHWRPLDPPPAEGARCRLSASTVQRWLDGAGRRAQQTVEGQRAGVPTSGQVGTDGLWARLRGKAQRVVLALVDSASGLVWPPVVVLGEDGEGGWKQLFQRAKEAGLDREALRGVTSDGAAGLVGYLNRSLAWVNHQRCVFHLWRNLAGELAARAAEAATGLAGEAARTARQEARRELGALVWAIYRNFEPAQWRSERKRQYRRPGQSPLAMAGVPPGELSYLDALGL